MKKIALGLCIGLLLTLIPTALALTSSSKTYTDVHENDWYYPFVTYISDLGFFGGYSDGSFKPNQSITRAETAKVLSLLFGILDVRETVVDLHARVQILEDKISTLDFPGDCYYKTQNQWYSKGESMNGCICQSDGSFTCPE